MIEIGGGGGGGGFQARRILGICCGTFFDKQAYFKLQLWGVIC